MPAVLKDYLLRPAAGAQTGVWVRIVHNTTAAVFISSAATDTNGLFSMPAPTPGGYTVYSGPTAAGPWTATGDTAYYVPVDPNDPAGTAYTQTAANPTIAITDTGSAAADTIVVTSTAKTAGRMINLYQSTSAFSGVGIFMNFGNTGGSFTGNFLECWLNNVIKAQINSLGVVTANAFVTIGPASSVLLFDNTVTASQGLYSTSRKSGLAPGNGLTSIKLESSLIGDINQVTYDYNVPLVIWNWTASGAAVSIGNWSAGDGIYVQTTDTGLCYPAFPPNAINVFAGTSPQQPTDTGTGGTVTYTATTLQDTAKAWAVNQWVNRYVVVGTSRLFVTSNTATVLTGTGGWTAANGTNVQQVPTSTPANGTTYNLFNANGTGINIQRFSSGNAMRIIGQSGSGPAAPLIFMNQAVNGPSLSINVDTGTTTANTVEVTFTAKTSGNALQLFHSTSAFSGAGLYMNFAAGSGTFTGSFLLFQVNTVNRFQVNASGVIVMTPPASNSADLIQITQQGTGRSFITTDTGSTSGDTATYSVNAKTSGNVLNVFHNVSAFAGNGLLMNLAAGSGTFTGNFLRMQVNAADRFIVQAAGNILVAAGQGLDVLSGALVLGSANATSVVVGRSGQSLGFYGVAAVTKAAAITTPTAPSAGYVQAEAQSMKTAVDAIRVALTNIGITA